MTKLHFISPKDKITSYDAIFIHGLNGHPSDTWTPEGIADNWLHWLDQDLPEARILSVEYDAIASKWLGSETMPIYDRANNLLALFDAHEIGSRPVVFITHSLGGLLAKKILQNASGAASRSPLVAATSAIVFLGTPNHGSDFVRSFGVLRKLLRITELTDELESNKTELRELHNWYRDNSGTHGIETLSFFETRDTKFGRVVNEVSSDPGIPNAQLTPIDADHFTICKPTSKNELVYLSVTRFLRELFPPHASRMPDDNAGPIFKTAQSFSETVKALEDSFYFRWERGSFDAGLTYPIVYWPVRLRHPTFIHAAQSFAAAGLQQRGADVKLFIDDLGVQNYDPGEFAAQLTEWFASVGGDETQLKIVMFSEVIPQDFTAPGAADPWPAICKWLGETPYRLDVILQVSKLFPSSGDWKDLNSKRPRRLLTPAMVWTCLSHIHESSPQRSFVTLGGRDEKPLWDAWRDQKILPASNVGHLYAPQLIDSDNQHGDTPLHMANPLRYSLEWNSKDDIRLALSKEFETDRWGDQGKLVWWCIRSCVFLPKYFRNEAVKLDLSSGVIHPHTPLQSASPEVLFSGLTEELAKWL